MEITIRNCATENDEFSPAFSNARRSPPIIIRRSPPATIVLLLCTTVNAPFVQTAARPVRENARPTNFARLSGIPPPDRPTCTRSYLKLPSHYARFLPKSKETVSEVRRYTITVRFSFVHSKRRENEYEPARSIDLYTTTHTQTRRRGS